MKKLRLDVEKLEVTTFAAASFGAEPASDPAGGEPIDTVPHTCFVNCSGAY